MEAQLGLRVVRGHDWDHKNQDGGFGHLGTVIKLSQGKLRPSLPSCTAMVQWDNGEKGLYRTGHTNAFDLRVFDSAPAGVLHMNIWCDGCNCDEIRGIRWRCMECFGIDLCTECYMSDKHVVTHVFMRVHSSEKSSMGPKMLPRSESSHVVVKGIFPGANVFEYPAWFQRKSGKGPGVTTVAPRPTEGEQHTDEGQVMVQFGSGAPSRPYCVGRGGRVELSCGIPQSGGAVYIGHLPCLGVKEELVVGDKVKIALTLKECTMFQRRHNLQESDLENVFRKDGVIVGRTDLGDCIVQFKNIQESLPMNAAALKKIHPFCPGQTVRMIEDVEMVKRLQSGHGGWTASMGHLMRKIGRVVAKDGKDVVVKFSEKHKYIFCAASLRPVKAPIPNPGRLTFKDALGKFFEDPDLNILTVCAIGDVQYAKQLLDEKPAMLNYEPVPGRTLLVHVILTCRFPVVKMLVDEGAFIESVDCSGYTPLMHAIDRNRHDVVKLLLEHGADINTTCREGLTPLHQAAAKGHTECAAYLIDHGADVTMKSQAQVTPLATASTDGNDTIVDLIVERKESDFKTPVGKNRMSIIHFLIIANRGYAITKICEKLPRLVNLRDPGNCTPLMMAACWDAANAADALLKTGHCDLNAIQPQTRLTAIAMALAAKRCNVEVLNVLIKSGADMNVPNLTGNTTLHIGINVRGKEKVSDGQPFLIEMKEKFKSLGIRTNEDALLAALVWHGADINVSNYDILGLTLKQTLLLLEDPVAPALIEIQKLRNRANGTTDSANDITEPEVTDYGQSKAADFKGNRTKHARSSRKRGRRNRFTRLADQLSAEDSSPSRGQSPLRTRGGTSLTASGPPGIFSEGDWRKLQVQLAKNEREMTSRMHKKAERTEHHGHHGKDQTAS